MSIHATPFDGAGRTYELKDGTEFRVEDWWDRVSGESWAWSKGNPAVLIYAMRTITAGLPDDDEVVYGKDARGLGRLIHVNELGEQK